MNQNVKDALKAVLTVVLVILLLVLGAKLVKTVWYWGEEAAAGAGAPPPANPYARAGVMGANAASMPRRAAVPTTPSCDPGYTFNESRKTCVSFFDEPKFAGPAKCKPGEKRRIPDPSRPGGFKLQVCGYAPTGS